MHKGNIVMVEGRLMHELKVNARDRDYIARRTPIFVGEYTLN